MTDRRLNEWCAKIVQARIENRYNDERRLNQALDRILAEDAAKEKRITKICFIAAVPFLLLLLCLLWECVAVFILGILCFTPFMAEAMKNGGDIK